MWTTPARHSQPQECGSSWTTSMGNPVFSSQLRCSRKGSSHFWTSYSSGTQMAPSQQRCTGKPPTQTATLTLNPTIHWPTNLRWSRHCTAGQEQSAQTSLLRAKRPGTSGRPSSTTGTREEYFNTGSTKTHRWPDPGPSCHPPLRLWFVWGSVTSPCSTRSEGLLPPEHHPETATIVRPKDHVLTEEQAGVVYQVPCASCPTTYIDQTSRCLGQRVKEHQKAVEAGDCANSALPEHAWTYVCMFTGCRK